MARIPTIRITSGKQPLRVTSTDGSRLAYGNNHENQDGPFKRPTPCQSPMTIRDWQEVLEGVVGSSADPTNWRAVAGNLRRGLGEDMYLGHPTVGVFHLKTFAKNPFEVE